MESLECPNALAKQVLSQLSYTPIREASLDSQPCGERRKPSIALGCEATARFIKSGLACR